MKTSYFSISPYFSSGAPVVRFCPVPPDLPESRAAAFGVRRGPAASADGSPAACGSAASGPRRRRSFTSTAPWCHGENLKCKCWCHGFSWRFFDPKSWEWLPYVAICYHGLSLNPNVWEFPVKSSDQPAKNYSEGSRFNLEYIYRSLYAKSDIERGPVGFQIGEGSHHVNHKSSVLGLPGGVVTGDLPNFLSLEDLESDCADLCS